jgi:mycofactocin biosynthetic radical S-adenosylmethionine protein MftC
MTRPPLVLVPQYFGSTVFDRRTSRYIPFDQPATDFLRSLCDADAAAVIETSDSDSCGVLDFYQNFYRRGFFTVDGRFAGVALDAIPPSDHLLGPLALHLEVVAACNLKCAHCFAGELPRKEDPLSLNELDQLFAQMAAMGTFRIGLTGGEPLLRKDLFEIIDLALSHGLCPCVTTNGLLITEDIARQFGKRELVWLNVSLEGATAATNDAIRGSGTFERVIDQLKILRKHCRFTLAFTIMSTNLHEVQACARLAEEMGAGTAVFRPLYPVGIARHHLDLMPTFQQYSDALLELESMRDDHLDLNHIDPFSPARRQEAAANVCQNHGCGAGNTVCSVSVSGDVSPCSFLGPDSYTANVREQTLRDIWDKSCGFTGIRVARRRTGR